MATEKHSNNNFVKKLLLTSTLGTAPLLSGCSTVIARPEQPERIQMRIDAAYEGTRMTREEALGEIPKRAITEWTRRALPAEEKRFMDAADRTHDVGTAQAEDEFAKLREQEGMAPLRVRPTSPKTR